MRIVWSASIGAMMLGLALLAPGKAFSQEEGGPAVVRALAEPAGLSQALPLPSLPAPPIARPGENPPRAAGGQEEATAPSERERRPEAAARAPRAKAERAGRGGTYEVKRGETPGGIAARYGVSVASLMRANGLSRASDLRAGASLVVPGKSEPAPEKRTRASAQIPGSQKRAEGGQAGLPPREARAAGEGRPGQEASARQRASEAEPLFEEDRAERPKARKDKGSSARGWFLTGEEGTGPNLVGSAGMLFGLVVRLGVVLMLAYLGARSLRRLSLGRNAPSSGEGLVKVLETVALGANRWVHVVAVGEQTYLIGSTSQQTVMMAELRESGAVQELRARGERPGGLAGRLGGLFGGKRDSGFGSSLNAASSLLAEKLGELKSLGTTSRFTGGKA